MNLREASAARSPPAALKARDRGDGVIVQLASLVRALAASSYRRQLALLAAGVVAVVCANAAGQIRLNAWHGAFFDALEQRAVDVFSVQLLVFGAIVSVLLVMVVAQTWLQEMLKVRLRAWLINDLLDEWLVPKRAYRLALAGEFGVNPDQRMQEDARHLTELSAELGVGLLQASLLLASFVGVLWLLSAQVVFNTASGSLVIPGYLVWCALGYALLGTWAAWLVGRPLIPLNAERYSREAELRFSLVRLSESAEAIALYAGEPEERRVLDRVVGRVIGIMRELANKLARLTWVTSGYGWLAIVVPILVAAPGYFGGSLSFGALMMVVNAFYQVQQALRWYVDNFSRIADWRATLLRVVSFRNALLMLESLDADGERITYADHPDGRLGLGDLSIRLTDGRATLDDRRFELQPGERVLVAGEPGSGKSMLFRALAGLWPCGSGTIALPPREEMMFMPQRPYLPLGALRGTVTYPAAPDAYSEEEVRAALERVDLAALIPALDREERWDRSLSLDERQRLAFARLLLHAPRWVILDDASSALDEEHLLLMLSIFEQELVDTAVMAVGRRAGRAGSFFDRTIRLHRLNHEVEPALQPATPSA
ncbi:ABC transporter ATP-binding protein/permease [Marinimicrococcus flavescens]|uniref:ABC transporter ATP-binding protein/permease n=1 Tax=Marinimicrococcus flavescens TaxID=3031815 RepID=A0AAP3UYZ4_9PROT|nr:ABC transporter ATP-binding protein/permease [Marinimicrococcus flavescens]